MLNILEKAFGPTHSTTDVVSYCNTLCDAIFCDMPSFAYPTLCRRIVQRNVPIISEKWLNTDAILNQNMVTPRTFAR